MLPQINGKSFLECTETDLKKLIDNTDYRENEYIDYKLNFAFLEMSSGKERNAKKAEFKSDVCSFANAEGGYILFGIREKKGCASVIEGIDIPNDNTDKFELDRSSDLTGIQPKIPSIQFHFVKLESGKYIVILFIRHDGFAPYIHLVDEKDYRIYKRYGNGKKAVPYSEIRQMFNLSISLEQSITNYLRQRINHYYSLGNSFGESFVHLSFIPETFTDAGHRQNMFVLERQRKVDFGSIFSAISCYTSSIPCVDGIRFITYPDNINHAEGYVRNNGIVEACLSLDEDLKRSIDVNYPNGKLRWKWLWKIIQEICEQYTTTFVQINTAERIYVCLSIIGCRNVITMGPEDRPGYTGKIDRNEVFCDPIVVYNLSDENELELILKKLHISFLLAIGVKYDDTLKQLIEEVYGSANKSNSV